ncbi:MAG: MBL fold metallo-hydrolase [Candidatus Woesearchaeota archaeon]
METKISVFGQHTILFKNSKNIYFESSSLPKKRALKADYILLSGNPLGINVENIASLVKKTTKILCPYQTMEFLLGAKELKDVLTEDFFVLETLDSNDLSIEKVASYKVDKILNPHDDFNGYLITIGNERFYCAGPTDLIPEMNFIHADVACIPVSGFGMDLFEAVAATNVLDAKVFCPISYDESEEAGLTACSRFLLKSMAPSDGFRKLPVPETVKLHDN